MRELSQMTPADLQHWIDACVHRRHFSDRQPKRDAAAALGITSNALTARLKGRVQISRETALACTAILAGLKPYPE